MEKNEQSMYERDDRGVGVWTGELEKFGLFASFCSWQLKKNNIWQSWTSRIDTGKKKRFKNKIFYRTNLWKTTKAFLCPVSISGCPRQPHLPPKLTFHQVTHSLFGGNFQLITPWMYDGSFYHICSTDLGARFFQNEHGKNIKVVWPQNDFTMIYPYLQSPGLCLWISSVAFQQDQLSKTVEKNGLNGNSPQIIHFNKVFHDKPSILGYHLFLETPKWKKGDIATKSHSWCPQPFGLTSPKPHDRMPAIN